MSILFLDVDGVLNTHIEPFADGGLDKLRLCLLSRIIAVIGCDIILSSAWRWMGCGPDSVFQQCLRGVFVQGDEVDDYEHGIIAGAIKGHTGPEPNGPEDRDVTIRRWLAVNGEPERWVAIDDLPCIMRLGPEHAVQTDPKIGLTKELTDRVIGLLWRS